MLYIITCYSVMLLFTVSLLYGELMSIYIPILTTFVILMSLDKINSLLLN